MATATVAARPISSQVKSDRDDNRTRDLAARLADSCVNPSYMPDLWAIYFHRFLEVLLADALPEGC